jgi:cytochrome b subunit of formate dehydrogenase
MQQLRALSVLLAILCSGSSVRAQDNDECLDCHDDPDLEGERWGREISVYVNPRVFVGSAHEGVSCVECHNDLAEEFDGEHDEELEVVHCGDCHKRQAREHRVSLHGQAQARGDRLAPTCRSCHGRHDIQRKTNPASPTYVMNVPHLCGRCHHEGTEVSLTHDIPQDRILQNYSQSIHGEGLFKKGLTVSAVCTSCHTAHKILPHTDTRSSIHRDNVAQTCTTCHTLIEQVHQKVIEGRLWEEQPHKIPACVDCHSPHKIRRVFYPAGMANRDCLRCHGAPELETIRDGEKVSLFVDEAALNASMHSRIACAQCHTEVTSLHERSCQTIENPVDCSICHADEVQQHESSIHGQLAARGDPDAPVCLDCHAHHTTLGKQMPTSPTFARNVPDLCGRCHREGEKAAVRIEGAVPNIVESYNMSIHGKGLVESGLLVTATCSDCHGAHAQLAASDPRSTVHADNISNTCGTCHHGITETFATSIHAPGVAETDRELPTCEDCHTSHAISRTDLSDFRVRMMDQCGRCHETEAETFFDTFHGKVSRLGTTNAANCYDCHGTHDILPPSNPASTLGRERVVETCAQCHEGAHRRFAGYLTHATHHDPDKYPWLFWTFWFMTSLLVGTLSFAMLHTLAWLVRLWLTRDQWRRHVGKPDGKLYRRFTATERAMHFTMLLSFFTLALTGMVLKFSYMPWAQFLADRVGGFQTTGTLHRLGAILLLTLFAIHLFDLRRRKIEQGVSWFQLVTGPNSLMFNKNDLKELIGSLKWFFGIGPRPHYGRFTYWEKFDYFAVFWGVAVIGSTGLVLWFPELFTYLLPGWSVNVATIIHSDEALLAVAFIFTVHFFNTHFRPDKFPMDPVIFTGRVPLDELEHDKPREYEERVAAGDLDAYLVDPYPAKVQRAFKIFGLSALAIGLTLIGLIVYTMLFGYQ